MALGSSRSCQVLILWSIPGDTPAYGESRSCMSLGVACEIRQIRGKAALRFGAGSVPFSSVFPDFFQSGRSGVSVPYSFLTANI